MYISMLMKKKVIELSIKDNVLYSLQWIYTALQSGCFTLHMVIQLSTEVSLLSIVDGNTLSDQ